VGKLLFTVYYSEHFTFSLDIQKKRKKVAWGKFKVRYRPKVVVLLLAGASSVNSFKKH
jgi:hypothetical protein